MPKGFIWMAELKITDSQENMSRWDDHLSEKTFRLTSHFDRTHKLVNSKNKNIFHTIIFQEGKHASTAG